MRLIDTHTHLYEPEFDNDREETLQRAFDAGVEKLLFPNIDTASLRPMLSLCSKHGDRCFPMIGLHPTSVNENYREQLDSLFSHAESNELLVNNAGSFVAIGEIGLDFYWDKTFITEQIDALKIQIDFAIDKNLPVAIHTREAMPEMLAVLRDYKGRGLKGVLHAFSGTPDNAIEAVDLGFLIGIGGQVTYKKSLQPDVVKAVGVNNIVLETDSPYLSPTPYRGKRNESSYICIINNKVAEILGMSPEETSEVTYLNSCKLFNI